MPDDMPNNKRTISLCTPAEESNSAPEAEDEAECGPLYFSPSDIEDIVKKLMSIVPQAPKVTQKVRATYALNAVRILQDRIGNYQPPVHLTDLLLPSQTNDESKFNILPLPNAVAGNKGSEGRAKNALAFLYGNTHPAMIQNGEFGVPQAVAKLIREYAQGKHTKEKVLGILGGLSKSMITYYFSHQIEFGDPDELPTTIIMGDRVKTYLQELLEQHQYVDDPKAVSSEIWKCALERTFGVGADADSIAQDLAEIISRHDYSQLVLRVGLNDPTPQQLAAHFVLSVQKAYEMLKIDLPKEFNPESIIELRSRPEFYQKELELYKSKRGGFFVGSALL